MASSISLVLHLPLLLLLALLLLSSSSSALAHAVADDAGAAERGRGIAEDIIAGSTRITDEM